MTSLTDQLRAAPFLQGLTDNHVWHLARHVTAVEFAKDEMLFREGDERQFFAILVSGSVAIEKHEGAGSVRLATLGAGEAIGEGLLLDETRHGTSGRAIEQTTALRMDAEQV